MIDDDGERKRAAVGALNGGAQDERRPVVQQFLLSRVRIQIGVASGCGVHAAGQLKLRHVHDIDARRFDEETDINAAHIVAFDEKSYIVRVRMAGRHFIVIDLVGDRLERRKIFHLLDAEHIGQAHQVADGERDLVEPVVEGGRRQRRRTRLAIVNCVEETFHVVRADS